MSRTLRPATAADLPGVAAIYAHAVEHTHATFDLVPPGLDVWEARLEQQGPLDAMFVAVDPDEAVLGFAYSATYRTRPAYDLTREVTVYLAEAARGLGLGSTLYDVLLAALAEAGVHTVLATIALPNDASEALHRSHGFTKVGHLTEVGHKFGRWVDIATYQRLL